MSNRRPLLSLGVIHTTKEKIDFRESGKRRESGDRSKGLHGDPKKGNRGGVGAGRQGPNRQRTVEHESTLGEGRKSVGNVVRDLCDQ